MKMLIHNLYRIPLFFKQISLYNFSVAFNNLIFPFHRLFGPKKYNIAVQKHKAILNYLFNHYIDILKNYNNIDYESTTFIKPESTIWVCWWDGQETMPSLVKACYNSILKHANSHPVQLITKNNYQEFITIPDYILEKVNSGIISITHFSNILRANLLYEYGGIWIDATILILRDIIFDKISFFTLKAPAKNSVSVTLVRFSGLSDFSKRFYNQYAPEISRWSGFLLAGIKNDLSFKYLLDILYAYWKDHNDQIDYLLFDYMIALGYDNIKFMKNEIDNVPCNAIEKFELEKVLNNEYNKEVFEKFSLTTFHKLTWKKNFTTITKNKNKTIYSYILDSN